METIAHIAEHVLEHSLADTLYLIPFLFVTYLAMEWLEHKTAARPRRPFATPVRRAHCGRVSGRGAPVRLLGRGGHAVRGSRDNAGDAVRRVPLHLRRDAAHFPGRGGAGNTILSIMGAKVVIGMVMGFIVDAVRAGAPRQGAPRIHELCEQDQCGCNHDCHTCEQAPERAYEHHDDVEHTHEHGHGWKGILKSATKHTVQVTLFIFLITIALNVVLETVGEDALAQFLGANPLTPCSPRRSWASFRIALPAWSSPSCTWRACWGAGAMLAGLLVSAGVGLLVLVRANRPWRQNALIIVALYATGVFWGLVCNGLGVMF